MTCYYFAFETNTTSFYFLRSLGSVPTTFWCDGRVVFVLTLIPQVGDEVIGVDAGTLIRCVKKRIFSAENHDLDAFWIPRNEVGSVS